MAAKMGFKICARLPLIAVGDFSVQPNFLSLLVELIVQNTEICVNMLALSNSESRSLVQNLAKRA